MLRIVTHVGPEHLTLLHKKMTHDDDEALTIFFDSIYALFANDCVYAGCDTENTAGR